MRSYAYAWPLALHGDSAAWQVEPSAEVYAAIGDVQLRDLEVVDGDGNPVPMAPRGDDATIAAAASVALPLFELPLPPDGKAADDGSLNLRIERASDGRLRSLDAGISANANRPGATASDFILDASAVQAAIDTLHLDWDDTASVNAQFSVAASDDLQHWRTLVASASLIGLTQNGVQLSRHDIGLGGAHAAYLRLHRLDAGAALARLRASVRAVATSTPLRAARQWLTATLTATDTQAQTTAPVSATYYYAMPAALPIEAVRVDLASDNSIARVRVDSHASGKPGIWLPRANTTAFRLSAAGGEALASDRVGNDEIATSAGPRSDQWRIEASPPLDHSPTLSVAWRPQRFVFLAQGHGPYRLIAGSANSRRADYPVEVALAGLRSRLGADWQPPIAALGARDTLAGEDAMKPAPAAEKPRDWKTWLLWAVLVGAAALIGNLALSLLRGPRQ